MRCFASAAISSPCRCIPRHPIQSCAMILNPAFAISLPPCRQRCRIPESPRARIRDPARSFVSACSVTIMQPRPVASVRPRDPPRSTGLPVTTAVCVCRDVHRIRVHDPRHGLLVRVHVRRGNVDFRADELVDLRGIAPCHALQFARRKHAGSQMMPPFPPPNGIFVTAHFHVIHDASARTSSS